MTDRPILMSAPMVRAHLADRKTMTRRTIKPQPPASANLVGIYAPGLTAVFGEAGRPVDDFKVRLRFKPGDRLWVREAWRAGYNAEGYREDLARVAKPSDFDPKTTAIEYLADDTQELGGKDRPSIHMPRWASRLTLIVKAVKVERLQDISEEDAIAEGIEWRDGFWATWNADGTMRCGGSPDPVEAYRCLWININGNGSWESNPWVAAISYECHKANIDAMEKAG